MLDTAPEREFDDLTAIAAAICGVPISLVSFVAADRQWFKAEHGLGARETSRDVSFCAHTLENHRTLVVQDTHHDPRFAANALVTGEPGIRFYAGAPIVTAQGHALGTVCVIDREPRTLTATQVAALEALARQASSLLEHRISSAVNAELAAKLKQSLLQAEEDRQRLRMAMDGAKLAAWYYDPARNVVGGDDRMAQLFGMAEPEGPAELWLQAIVEEDRERVSDEFAASVQGAPYDTQYRVAVNGEERWIHARAQLNGNGDGSVSMTGICEDVTREKTLKLDVAKFAERLTIAQEASGASSFDWDLKSNRVNWIGNNFGRPPAAMGNAPDVFALVHEADREALVEVIRRAIESGETYRHECRGYWPDGSVHWVATTGKPMRNEQGEVTTVVGVNLDITDRKLSEEALLRTEKLAAVGRLASTISHEINNPLEAVTNLLYLTRLSPSLSPADRENLDQADRELSRVSNIVAQNLRFHRDLKAPTDVVAAELLQDVLGLFASRLAASTIRVVVEALPDVRFPAYEGEIRQVLNNLVSNAFDVMRQGGTLTMRARYATNWADGRPGVAIAVADTGAGISQETQQRLFEAFFSTKGIHGSGLGLWISRRIVQKHEGELRFWSSTGTAAGTVFRLWLPLTAAVKAGDSPT